MAVDIPPGDAFDVNRARTLQRGRTAMKGLSPVFDTEKLLKQEISYYGSFTNKISTSYGKIFHNSFNPLSHESNHAHILNLNCDIEAALEDIVRFYRNRNLVPRIY